MRALALRNKTPRNHDTAAVVPDARGFSASRLPQSEAAELPDERDAWWLSRSQTPTFTRRRIRLSGACARALRAAGSTPGRITVEFNGASFVGATLSMKSGRYELDLGDALAREMAEVLDEDDGLDIELLTGRSQPTLAIHPYVGDTH